MCWNLKHLKEKHKWKATALYHKWMTRACFTSEWLTEASITSGYDHSEDEGWMTLTKRTSLLDVQWIWNEHGIYDVWFRLCLNQTSQITCDDESHSTLGRDQIRRQGVGLENIRHKRINLEKENQVNWKNRCGPKSELPWPCESVSPCWWTYQDNPHLSLVAILCYLYLSGDSELTRISQLCWACPEAILAVRKNMDLLKI